MIDSVWYFRQNHTYSSPPSILPFSSHRTTRIIIIMYMYIYLYYHESNTFVSLEDYFFANSLPSS